MSYGKGATMQYDDDCDFCAIVARAAPARIIAEWPDTLAIEPLKPVTRGHVLVLPKRHVADFTEDPDVSAATMRAAAQLAVPPANVITSAGREATQSVWHLHLHIVPRAENDGLALPWYSGRRRSNTRSAAHRTNEEMEQLQAATLDSDPDYWWCEDPAIEPDEDPEVRERCREPNPHGPHEWYTPAFRRECPGVT